MILYFLIWLFGAVAYAIYDRELLHTIFRTRSALAISAALFLVSLAISKGGFAPELHNDILIGITSAILVLLLATRGCEIGLYNKIARVLADGSYTMYLFHFPFLAFIASVFLANQKFPNSIRGYLVYLVIATVSVAYCHGMYWLFERHTGSIRRYCIRQLKKNLASRSRSRETGENIGNRADGLRMDHAADRADGILGRE